MNRLSVIAMTRFLREKGWPFRRALEMARTVRDLATAGTLPRGDIRLFSSTGEGDPVTILQLEIAGGVVRLETTPL